MAWIRLTEPEEATGLLKREYDAAMQRAGRIWNILSLMSPNPNVLRASMDFYGAIIHGPSPLSRAQREMLAVVVARTVGCRY
jgi:alkylhydroperoxidase family enzyme